MNISQVISARELPGMSVTPGRWAVRVFALLVAFATGPLLAGGDAPEYDMNSWQSIIADDCRAFFDGCNQCRREPGKTAACTRMACAVYQRPRCLDGTDPSAANTPRTVEYRCDAGATFSVVYDAFEQDGKIVALGTEQVMLRGADGDWLNLRRERSASGERYADASGLAFLSRGDEALVTRGDKRLYQGCRAQSWPGSS